MLALTLAVGAIAYLRIVGRGTQAAGLRSPAAVAALCALSIAGAWAAPALFSSDVYAYAAYGELARTGGNPYAHAPLPVGIPIFDAAVVQWGNPPPVCVYGPPFVWIAAAIVAVTAPLGTAVALDGLRLLASGALVTCALLAYAAYSGNRQQRLTAAATIALNPASIWCAAEGHNDALALAAVLAGVALARRGRPFIGAFVGACAGALKLPALFGALPAAVGRRGQIGAAIGAVVAIVLSLPVLIGAATQLAPHAQYAPQASFQAMLAPAFAALLPIRLVEPSTWAAVVVAAAAFVCAALRGFRDGDRAAWLGVGMAGWLLLPNPYPWYGLWLAALAAIAPGTPPAAVLIGLTLVSVLRYLPDAASAAAPAPNLWLGVAAMLPYLLLLARRRDFVIINRSP